MLFLVSCLVWLSLLIFALYLLGIAVSFHGKQQLKHLRQGRDDKQRPVVVGFFHPYCNAGGGGERVLWVAIRALQNRYPNVRCVVYTGDVNATPDQILQRAKERFNIVLPAPGSQQLDFVYLTKRNWVEARRYPYFTMLGQSLGSVLLGLEAMWKFVPDIYIDSMGYAFTLPLFRYFGGCSVCCYVHYPTISTDMLERVSQGTTAYNNRSTVTRNPVLSQCKVYYYKLFAYLYGWAGKKSDLIMVNSSWTEGHILSLWQSPSRTHVIYPPCDTAEFLQLPLDNKSQTKTIVSVAQFRPEKDHPLQINAFKAFLDMQPDNNRKNYKLVLVGSCRNDEDAKRVEDLKDLAQQLDIKKYVEFRLNIGFSELKQCLCEATIGLHTMWNEHFGIGVVEMMSAGTIVLAHKSGGPKLDIVTDFNHQKTGYLADSETTYAEAMNTIFNLSQTDIRDLQMAARLSVDRFSTENFEEKFLEAMKSVI